VIFKGRRSGLLRALTLLAALHVTSSLGQASSGAVSFGPHDVHSVFYVAKSENQNQVHYAVRLDSACRPLPRNPIFAYWRRLKGGVRVDEPLVSPGTRVYGASDDQQVEVQTTGGRVKLYVKALKRVAIEVQVKSTPSGCQAVAHTTIQGQRARLSHAFLQLRRFGFGVSYVDVFGYRESDGMLVTERLR
jgi:hypothetical protein